MPPNSYSKRLTQDELNEMKAQHQAGWTVQAMADHWGKDTTSVKHWIVKGFQAYVPWSRRDESQPKPEKEDFITAKDPVTGRDLIEPEKVNRGKESYMDYLRILAGRENKKIRKYFYSGDKRHDE